MKYSRAKFNVNSAGQCTIQYNTGGCPAAAAVCVGHKFYIQLALPISP